MITLTIAALVFVIRVTKAILDSKERSSGACAELSRELWQSSVSASWLGSPSTQPDRRHEQPPLCQRRPWSHHAADTRAALPPDVSVGVPT